MKKLLFAVVFTLIAITMPQTFVSGDETFEDLVSDMENRETEIISGVVNEGSGDMRFSVKSAASSFSINDSQQEFTSTPNQGMLATRQEIASHQIASLRNYLTFTTDKIENITWVRAKVKNVIPYITIYAGEQDGIIWLRLLAEVRRTILLDIGQIVLNIDGEIHRIQVDPRYKQISSIRESRGITRSILGYTEKIDIPVSGSPQIIAALQQIPNSSNTAVRLRGQNGSVDFNMSSTAKNAFGAVLQYYEAKRAELQ